MFRGDGARRLLCGLYISTLEISTLELGAGVSIIIALRLARGSSHAGENTRNEGPSGSRATAHANFYVMILGHSV